jgi:V8-like Glu-specific endopeptidase
MNACGRGAHCALERQGAPFLFIALLTVLLAAGVLAAPSAGAHAVAPESTQQTTRFWTAARMKRARPLDLPRPGRGSVMLDGPAAATAATPRIYPPSAAGEASASSSFETVPDPTAEATRQNGAIFIETPFGFGRCSGTSVNAPNFSVVFTAAHCIHSGGRGGSWADFRWAFVPGYRYGQRPFGVFPAKWLDTTRQWRVSGSENYDVGAAVVGRNQDGELLGKAVGGTGIAFGLKARQVFDVHGYPAAEPFDGETQQVCTQTPFLGHDARSFLTPGPLNLAVDCDVTGGASGGGWTISGGRILNSVTNYGYGDDPDTDFGAYFGDEVARLFHRAGLVK